LPTNKRAIPFLQVTAAWRDSLLLPASFSPLVHTYICYVCISSYIFPPIRPNSILLPLPFPSPRVLIRPSFPPTHLLPKCLLQNWPFYSLLLSYPLAKLASWLSKKGGRMGWRKSSDSSATQHAVPPSPRKETNHRTHPTTFNQLLHADFRWKNSLHPLPSPIPSTFSPNLLPPLPFAITNLLLFY
jgi:hypothetical protein